MKKGFTMIELIFVIVILGILASVAIPRLAGTRADAEITATIANMRTLLSDIATYYTASGTFARDISAMTNVKLTNESQGENMSTMDADEKDGPSGELSVGGEPCIKVQMRTASHSTPMNPNTPGSTDGRGCPAVVKFTVIGKGALCTQVTSAASMSQFITGEGGDGSGGTGPIAYCSTTSTTSAGTFQRSVNGIAIGSSASVY